jgi:hypothetical protein
MSDKRMSDKRMSGKRTSDKRTKKATSERERSLDESLEGTFPASDPVSKEQVLIVGRVQRSPLAGGPRVKSEKEP